MANDDHDQLDGSDEATVTYRIEDWTGRVLFGGKEFASFEDGWEHIYKNDPQADGSDDQHFYDDYYVEQVPVRRP